MSETKVMTKAAFEKLGAYARGYAVYWCGENPEQPNVPNERNPYKPGTKAHAEWDRGQYAAMQDAQDGEE